MVMGGSLNASKNIKQGDVGVDLARYPTGCIELGNLLLTTYLVGTWPNTPASKLHIESGVSRGKKRVWF